MFSAYAQHPFIKADANHLSSIMALVTTLTELRTAFECFDMDTDYINLYNSSDEELKQITPGNKPKSDHSSTGESCTSTPAQPAPKPDQRQPNNSAKQCKKDIIDLVDSYVENDNVIPFLSDLLETYLKKYPSSLGDGYTDQCVISVLRLISFLTETRVAHALLVASEEKEEVSHE